MKHGRFETIEGGQEVALSKVIVDVRTTQQVFFDWLSWPRNFAKVMIAFALVSFLIPILLPIIAVGIGVLYTEYSSVSQFLPIRYPSWARMPDPGQLHAATDEPEPAAGIMYLGVVDAKDPYERSKQVFLSADDLTRHMLALGTTGSGKSEFLKGMTFNVFCWASGFFVSDAKADNKLPTDMYSQAVMFAREYDWLCLNYLLGGLSPSQIGAMRERLSNGLQPATAADADTLVQMTSNIMVKASGDSKSWQERGLNMFRGICRAVCHKRDMGHLSLSMDMLRDYLALDKIEELYVEGWKQAKENDDKWPTPYLGVKSYLEVGLPGFKVEIMLRKHGLLEEKDDVAADIMAAMGGAASMMFGGQQAQAQQQKPKKVTTQSNDTYNQHGYRADQIYPALSLLVDTYGHIFKRKFPEVDMQDVVVNNRICASLIPSLEKGSQEQESLGKLNLALLRVMMARALGMSVEGDATIIVDAKVTASATPFALFLDELAYQFAEGIALTAAQARSLNFFLCALAQDLEKLTEGDRAAEAGAMMANQAWKYFMKILGSDKTHELAAKTLGEARVAVLAGFERETGLFGSVRRDTQYKMEKRPRIEREVLENLPSGFATFAYRQRAHVMRTFYPSPEVPRVRYPRINRFLQIPDFEQVTMVTCAVELEPNQDKWAIDKIRDILESAQAPTYAELVTSDVIQGISAAARDMNPHTPAIERGIVLYQAGVQALHRAKTGATMLAGNGGGAGGPARQHPSETPTNEAGARQEQQPSGAVLPPIQTSATPAQPHSAGDTFSESASPPESVADSVGGPIAEDAVDDSMLHDGSQSSMGGESAEDFLADFDPLDEVTKSDPPLIRKPKEAVFGEEVAQIARIPETNDQAVVSAFETSVNATGTAAEPIGTISTPHRLDRLGADEVDLVLDDPTLEESSTHTNPDSNASASTPIAWEAADSQNGKAEIAPQPAAATELQHLARTRVDASIVSQMGPEVVGVKNNALAELVELERALGASPREAEDAAQNTEKAVAQSLSLLDGNRVNLSSTDIEMVFSELEAMIDITNK